MDLLDSEKLHELHRHNGYRLDELMWEQDLGGDHGRHPALRNHLFFHLTDRFRYPYLEELSQTARFYNSYFWFRVLCLQLDAESGPDAGREQQLHQLLEQAPTDAANWDWAAIEQLDALAKAECQLADQRDPRIDAMIADIDRRVAEQLRVILARPKLRALEAVWRSAARLVGYARVQDNVQLELLSCSKQELADDLRDNELEGTLLFKLLYTDVYRAADGERIDPYGAIIADYEFGPGASDAHTLGAIGRSAWIGHCPFIAAASPKLLDDDAEHFDQAQYHKLEQRRDAVSMKSFLELRESDDARFLVLTMPRVQLREAHDCEDEPLWGAASWALGMRLVNSFARYGWCPNIIGTDPDAGGLVHRLPPETDMTEKQEWELSECLGLVPLMNIPGTPLACFHSASTLARAKYFGRSEEGRDAELNFRLGHCQLPYLMILCRVAQYLLVVHRDSTWAERERVDQERELNRWLGEYVADRSVLNSATRARRILRKAQVTVQDTGNEKAWRILDLKLRPHFKYMGAFFTLAVVGRMPRRDVEP